MRRLTAPRLILFLLSSLSAGAQTVVIRNATVIDGTGAPARPATSIVISGGRIASVQPARAAIPAGAQVIDATGKYVIPGLWDMHVHLWDDDPRFDSYLAFGVTGVRDMGSDLARTKRWRDEIESGRRDGPRIYTSGMPVDGRESTNSKLPVIVAPTPAQAAVAVDLLDDSGVDYIKVLSSLSAEAYLALAQRARLRRVPFVGHVPDAVPVSVAVDLRQKSMEHLFGMMKLTGRDRSELLERLRLYAVWQVPTLTLWHREPSMQTSYEAAAELVGAMARAGVPLLAGTDTGDPGVEPGAALHDELELLVKAGLTPMAALQTATQNAARFFDEEADFGSIQKGRLADLVVLDADPLADIKNTRRIRQVIVRGRPLVAVSRP